MSHAEDQMEHLTTYNSAQCNRCNHIFLKKKLNPYFISWYKKDTTIWLCNNCARDWFKEINKRYHYLDDIKPIYADNLGEVCSDETPPDD